MITERLGKPMKRPTVDAMQAQIDSIKRDLRELHLSAVQRAFMQGELRRLARLMVMRRGGL